MIESVLKHDRYRSIISQMPDDLLVIEWLTVSFHIASREDEYLSLWKKMLKDIEDVAAIRKLNLKEEEKKLPKELISTLKRS